MGKWKPCRLDSWSGYKGTVVVHETCARYQASASNFSSDSDQQSEATTTEMLQRARIGTATTPPGSKLHISMAKVRWTTIPWGKRWWSPSRMRADLLPGTCVLYSLYCQSKSQGIHLGLEPASHLSVLCGNLLRGLPLKFDFDHSWKPSLCITGCYMKQLSNCLKCITSHHLMQVYFRFVTQMAGTLPGGAFEPAKHLIEVRCTLTEDILDFQEAIVGNWAC